MNTPVVRVSVICPSVFSFPDNNLSKYQWILVILGMCIDIVEIGLGLSTGKFVNFSRSYLLETDLYFPFHIITRVNVSGFSPNLVFALILWRSDLGLLMGKYLPIFEELSVRDTSILFISGH